MSKLNKVLKEQGRTKAWLARKMGVTPNTVQNWCNGKGLNKWKLSSIAAVLNVELKTIEND